jgi:hypothetical protein
MCVTAGSLGGRHGIRKELCQCYYYGLVAVVVYKYIYILYGAGAARDQSRQQACERSQSCYMTRLWLVYSLYIRQLLYI